MTKNHIGIDQYGHTWWDLGPHPRKRLQELIGGRVAKMYHDDLSQNAVHCGYIVRNLWITLYTIEPIHLTGEI
jgi:hypothetical protein